MFLEFTVVSLFIYGTALPLAAAAIEPGKPSVLNR